MQLKVNNKLVSATARIAQEMLILFGFDCSPLDGQEFLP